MLKKFIIKTVLLVVLILLGTVVIRNVVLEKVETVSQTGITLNKDDIKKVQGSGSFVDIDLIHKGSGKAVVLNTDQGVVLKLEEFKVTPGPDLFVYLSKNKNIKETQELGEFISLGKLKSYSGEQMYNLPANYKEYNSVVIWCRAFGVLFSVAELQ